MSSFSDEKREMSEAIESSLEGKTLFLTGATGMMGVATLARLTLYTPLRRIYALVRGGETRLWARLAETLPPDMVTAMINSFKIVAVAGDITEHDCGIDAAVLAAIRAETHIVVHAASTIHLKHELPRIAQNIIFPAMQLADMCLSFPNLTKFVFVSTAYVNAFLAFTASTTDETPVEERCYPLRADGKDTAVDELDNIREYGTTPEYSQMRHPFAYSYAKHLSERLITQAFAHAGRASSLMIFRPSCFGPAEVFPFQGFELIGSSPVTSVLCALLAAPPSMPLRLATGLRNPASATIDEVPVDVVVDRLIVHIAHDTSGPVHAVAGPGARRPIVKLLDAGCRLRSPWWPAPRIQWCPDNTNARLSFIAKTFRLMGCSYAFRSDSTEHVYEAMNAIDRSKWLLFPQRDADDVSDLLARSVFARSLLSRMLTRRGIPKWVCSVICKDLSNAKKDTSGRTIVSV